MKIIMPTTSVSEIEIGDRFLNTTWTVNGLWYREQDTGGKWRTYIPVKCDCGEEVRGRWDRLHTTNENRAPWSVHCRKCGYTQRRGMDTLWHNRAMTADEVPQNKIDDMTGKYFGDLFVSRRVGSDSQSRSLYECICSCGNIEIVRTDNLRGYKSHGARLACRNCLHKASNGERWVKSKLDLLKIPYSQEYIFKDLMGDGSYLRFDFALLNKNHQPYALIEFQGEQHYRPVSVWGGQEQFEKQQRYDNLKREYCKKKGIKLIEISYTKYTRE